MHKRKPSVRVALGFLFFLACAPLFTSCYVTRLAWEQNNLVNSRRPLDKVIADPATPPAVRERLVYTQKIIHYAEQRGLRVRGAYQHYVDLERPVISYIVQAAAKDHFEFHTWWFPVVGSVPYKGFFDKAERDEEAKDLKAKDFDVSTGGVGAFSSLGWFDDPVYRPMLTRSNADLAHLYFHELTHRTLWLAGSYELNENVAEFVARKLTPEFLDASGEGEKKKSYLDEFEDGELFRQWLKALKADLEKIYAKGAALEKISRETILKEKEQTILFYTTQKKPKFKADDLIAKREWNNASIMGASLYAPDYERFLAEWRCLGAFDDMGAFLAALKEDEKTALCGKLHVD